MLIVLAFIYMYKLQYDTVSCTCDHVLVLKLHNYTSAFRVFLRKRVKTGFKKKKKRSSLPSILITGVKLLLPSMGTEFCNQCCQSPSGLTFSFISESYHRVLPFWDTICQAVSFDMFPASTFVPSLMSSYVLQATSQIFILPAVFKIRFENWCTQWSTLAIIAITKPWATSQLSEENLSGGQGLEGIDPNPFFSSLQVIFHSSSWGRSLNHWWLCVFSVDKRTEWVWQLT